MSMSGSTGIKVKIGLSNLTALFLLSACSSTNISKVTPSPQPWAIPLPLSEWLQTRDDAKLPSGPFAVSLNDSLAFSEAGSLSFRPSTDGVYYGSERQAKQNVNLPAPSGELRGLAFEGSSKNLFIATADRVYVLPQRDSQIGGQNRSAGQLAELGGGGTGFDDVPAAQADLSGISRLTLSPEGHVLLASSCRVLILATRDDSFFGRRMTAGHVYTLAGNGCGTPVNGAAARETALGYLRDLVSDRRGNLLFSDQNGYWMVPQLAGNYFGQSFQVGRLYQLSAASALQTTAPAPASRLAVSSEGHLILAHSSGLYLYAARNGRLFNLQLEAGTLYPLVVSASANWSASSEARLTFNGTDRLVIRRGNHVFINEVLPDRTLPGVTPSPSPSSSPSSR